MYIVWANSSIYQATKKGEFNDQKKITELVTKCVRLRDHIERAKRYTQSVRVFFLENIGYMQW